MSHQMDELNQKSTEHIYDYYIRLYNLWFEEKKEVDEGHIVCTDKFFIDMFICGLFNAEVKSKMIQWFQEEPNSQIDQIVSLANDYQNEEDDIYPPDFLEVIIFVSE